MVKAVAAARKAARKAIESTYEGVCTIVETDAAAAISQSTKLFISPEIVINGGSKIIVEQDGRKAEYSASGEPAVYSTHQEITLELFKGWA